MVARNPTVTWPEIVLSDASTSARVGKAVRENELRKIAPRLYTPNLVDAPEAIIRRNLWPVLALLFPGTMVGYRTALSMTPTAGRTVFLVGRYDRRVRLPGVVVRMIRGAGPVEGDGVYAGTLHLASEARAFLECLSVKRVGAESPGLPRVEVEALLDRRLRTRGETWGNDLRDLARRIAPVVGLEAEARELHGMIGGLLGTMASPFSAPGAVARAAGEPYDTDRLARFSRLIETLNRVEVPVWADPSMGGRAFQNLAFFDAYFSNYIEGTEFTVEEAAEIVFQQKIHAARPKDAHDVLGTYRLVVSRHEMGRSVAGLVGNAAAFLDLLRFRHAMIMQERPEARPGHFKEEANRAGDTRFVAPGLVAATLARGLELLPALRTAFQRAVYVMFLVTEVHPFDDGNGRLARAMMNAELISAGERRILVPTAFRTDYLGALRRLSRNDDPTVLIRALDFVHEFTARIDFSDFEQARHTLEVHGAFRSDEEARVRMPE
jgi:hypothetical protein